MAVDTTSSTYTVAGKFWLPGDEDHAAHGQLVVAANSIQVELTSALTPAFETSERISQPNGGTVSVMHPAKDSPSNAFTVHGLLNDSPREITLARCFTNHRRVGDSLDVQHLSVGYAIRGAHVNGVDEEFTGLRVRFGHLDQWVGLTGFSISRGEGGDLSLDYQPADVPVVDLQSGGQLTIRPILTYPMPTETGGSIQRQIWLEVTRICTTWQEIGRILTRPLSSLLTLCTGEDCPVLEYKVMTKDEQWANVLVGSTPAVERKRPRDPLLTFMDVTLEGVAKWLNAVEDLGPLPPVVASSIATRNIRVETQLLELTTVAEGLHSALFPDDCRMDSEAAANIRSKIRDVLADNEPRHRQIVAGLLGYLESPGYKARLMRLAGEVSDVLPGITGKPNKWADEVNKCRNTFAHRSAGFLADNDLDRYVGVIFSMRWVLRGILLLQTGISPELLAKRVQESPSYDLVRRQLQELLPKIYR